MKPEHQKLLVKALVVIVIVLFIRYSYLWIKKQFAGLETSAIEPTAVVNGKTVVAKYSAGNAFPLMQGSAGSNVVKLQQFLNTYGGANLTVDGKFGPKTKAALASYNGSTSVKQADLTKWINTKVKNTDTSGTWEGSTGGNEEAPDYFSDSAQYPANLTEFATEVKTDLDSTYVFSTRGNYGVWAQMLTLKPEDLKNVSDIMTKTYGENLYNRISAARFNALDSVDILLLNKLIACGAGPA